MFVKIFSVTLVVLAFCHPNGCLQIQPRIVNGHSSERGQFPFFALLDIRYRFQPKKAFICGGTLISNDWIVTAAHCTYNVTKIAVHLGSLKHGEHEEGRHVFFARKKHFFIHPEYNDDTLWNDIALIKLSRPAVFSHLIQPVRFPSACEIPAGMDLIAIGNGHTATNGKLSEILRYTTVTTVPHDECDRHFKILDDLSVFCARSDNGSICQGDSGGPLVSITNHSFYGFTSFAYKQDCEKMPQGFTNAIHYFPWISGITGIHFNDCGSNIDDNL